MTVINKYLQLKSAFISYINSQMTTSGVHGAVAAKAKPVTSQFQFGPWTLTAVKSHILESEGPARQRFEDELELPQVPEMIFADNVLRVQHAAGYGVEFNALDALKLVDAHNDPLKVAVAQAWKEARADCEHINEVVKPFDWTFTTEYKGTLIGKDGAQLKVEQTDERIDLEKLKVREKIHFYEDILLFEDELSDNGSSLMNVKIRVMPTSFFILLRQFMRVDNVVVRVLDTRLHHEEYVWVNKMPGVPRGVMWPAKIISGTADAHDVAIYVKSDNAEMTVKKANICPFDVSLKDKFQKIVASGRKQPQGEDEQPEADETEHVIDDVEMEMGEIDEPESLAMAPAKHQKKSKVMRVRWMEAETSELLKYAHEYLEKRKTPSRNVCKSFIASSKAAGGELHKRSADNILKKISAMNVKARKTDE